MGQVASRDIRANSGVAVAPARATLVRLVMYQQIIIVVVVIIAIISPGSRWGAKLKPVWLETGG